MKEFAVEVVARPEIRCAGLKVRTTMQKASVDCPQLWEKQFGPLMDSFPADPAYPQQSFGVSVMIDDSNFDYWAVMPLRPDAAVPEGMDVFVIPAGAYAGCQLNSLAELGDAFNYLYGPWIAGQEKYAINMQGAGYELYTSDFCQTGKLAIYCPLLEK